MDIIKLVKEKEERVIKIRRDLHQIPELELELPKTMEYISKVLDEIGVKYKKLLNGNAIVAQIDGEQEGKCIAIRADSDALPDSLLPLQTEICMLVDMMDIQLWH